MLNLGAGYLWGLLAGQIVVMFAAAVGTFLATLLLRKCAVYVEPRIRSNAQVASLLAVINGPQAFKLIILTRLTPIPYGLQNALFSLVHVPMPEYMLATVTGLLPTVCRTDSCLTSESCLRQCMELLPYSMTCAHA